MSRPLHLNHVGDRWIREGHGILTTRTLPGLRTMVEFRFRPLGPAIPTACTVMMTHCRDDKGASAASVVAKRTTLENLSLLNTQFKEADRVAKNTLYRKKSGTTPDGLGRTLG